MSVSEDADFPLLKAEMGHVEPIGPRKDPGAEIERRGLVRPFAA